MTIHDELLEWYWTSGVQREGQYALSPSGWLDRLHRAARIARTVEASRKAGRPAMALWGTSQTGKSTLLSSYLDRPGDPGGLKSALTWPGGSNVRFCRESLTAEPPAGTAVLNPYDLESDASSCISRFQLAEHVADPVHPIEIRLAKPIQIMHALAMGYVTEAKLERYGEECRFNLQSFTETLDASSVSESRSSRNSLSMRGSYERLHEVADLLELLVISGYPRYSALAAGNNLKSARARLLECHRRLPSVDAVDNLAFTLFWDNHEVLNETYRQLVSWTIRHGSDWAGKRLCASPSVVALLLDVATYSRLHSPDPGTRSRFQKKLVELKVSVGLDHVAIGTTNGIPLLSDPEEFSLFQGNILELIIPVRREAIADRQAFVEFLSKADLLDCPGTGREQENRATRLDLEALRREDHPSIFTRLLKRGKTASLVASYSRDLTIDGFSIFARLMSKPGQPGQLSSGISTWWDAYGNGTSKRTRGTRSPLPLNLVMSFWGRFFKSTNLEAIRDNGIDAIFRDLDSLDELANPEVLSATLAVNYPLLAHDDARLPEPWPAREATIREVMGRADFERRFRSAEEQASFRAMAENGGTDFLFEVLRRQAGGSNRLRLVEEREHEGLELIAGLFRDAVPDEDHTARYREALSLWADRLDGALAAIEVDATLEAMSYAIRKMLSVPCERLEAVPIRLNDRRAELLGYLRKQCSQWVEHAKSSARDHLALLALRDVEHADRVVNGLMESVGEAELESWLLRALGHVASKTEGESYRRHFSTRMADAVFPVVQNRTHRTREQIIAEMDEYETRDRLTMPGLRNSPHYRQFVKPFVEHIRQLGDKLCPDGRPPQPGDDSLREIERRFRLGL